MDVFPMHLLILLVFLNRYVFGLFLKRLRVGQPDATVDWEPTVTVVTPLFNEGRAVERTIRSVMALDYPRDRLELIVVDDCSTDDSLEVARRAAAPYPNVRVLASPRNAGKRMAIARAVRHSTSELILSVDSDVEVDRGALRALVRRFTRPDIAAVGGRVFVSNADANWLTRMQAIKYFFGYEYLKNIERAFHSVMCLSGCLTIYRRSVLLELEPILESRNVLGVPIKYGEDRFLTRQIVKRGYRTFSTLDAWCYTLAPSRLSAYFSQQLRWRRSNLVDFLGGMTHAWRLHPLVCVHYVSLMSMLIAYPLMVVQQLADGAFFELAAFNLSVLALGAAIYGVWSRRLPPERRVHPLWFLSMAVLMPMTYVVLTPLAAFTLHSSSWETRKKVRAPAPAAPDPLAPATPALEAAP